MTATMGIEICFILWLSVALLAIVPLRSQVKRARLQDRGLCVKCRYILTGLIEPRCPECGQPFEPKGDAT